MNYIKENKETSSWKQLEVSASVKFYSEIK